jgi:heptosyltransferase-3
VSVLLVRAGALGDVLLLRRAVCALRRAGRRVELVAPSAPGAGLVGDGDSEVERLWPWDGPDVASVLTGAPAPTPLVAALRDADVVVAYTRSQDVVRALAAVGARVVAHDPSPPPAGPHASEWLCRPLRDLGVTAAPEPTPLAFSATERSTAEPILAQLPRRFLAIHPGSGSPAKNWPAERFVALAERFAPGQPVLLALGQAEEHWPEAPASHGARWLIARELPVRVLGAVLSRASLFVGNDSGASHLAAAAGAPTLALFGPTDASLWAPVGQRVRCLRAPGERLEALTVEAVCEAALALLA